jgi:hypothetical protein
MFTARNFTKKAYQCGLYEAQDVFMNVDDVDMIYLEPGKGYQLRENIHRRFVWHDFTKKLVLLNPGLKPNRLVKEYELFVAVCGTLHDLPHINAIKNWKEKCQKSVCWIDELWVADLPKCKPWLSALKMFEHIFVGYHGSVNAVSNAIGRQCYFMPGAVDAIRFSPYPQSPTRVIDVYNMGRRWEGIHQVLRNMATSKGIFYLYDTIVGSKAQTLDYSQHRDVIANLAKRSLFFIVAPGKMNRPEEVQGQIEIGYRFYEGSAAGAVMIGQAPDCESFHAMFDWPDAVIEIQPDGSDVAKVLSSLAAQPERLSEISRRNAVEALLRHDWVYRWKQILDIAGLKATPSLELREQHLKKLAGL